MNTLSSLEIQALVSSVHRSTMLFIGFQPLELSYGQNVEHLLIAKAQSTNVINLEIVKKYIYLHGIYIHNKIEN